MARMFGRGLTQANEEQKHATVKCWPVNSSIVDKKVIRSFETSGNTVKPRSIIPGYFFSPGPS
jgi:hypothetical protein